MKRWAAVGAVVAAVCSVVMLALPASAATSITAVGWWSANPQASAPEGGFPVQGSPDGTSASLAAIRVLVTPEPIVRAALVLTEAGGVSNENAALQLCPTSDPWQPVPGGELTEAPEPDCTAPIPLTRSATTASWSAEVTSLLGGASEVSIMVLVQPASEAPPPTVTPPPAPPFPPAVPPPAPSSPVAGAPLNLEIQFGPPLLSVDYAFSDSDDEAGSDTDFSDLSTGSGSDTFIVPTDSSFGSPFSTGSSSFEPSTFVPATPAADPAGLAADTPVPGQGRVLTGDPARFRTDPAPRDIPWGRVALFVAVSAVAGLAATGLRSRLRPASTLGF